MFFSFFQVVFGEGFIYNNNNNNGRLSRTPTLSLRKHKSHHREQCNTVPGEKMNK